MATVYKKINTEVVRNKQIPQATEAEKLQASNIVSTFVTLFKQKHLS